MVVNFYKVVEIFIYKHILILTEYKKNYQLAYRVFKNSLPELDDQTLKLGAGLLSGVSTLNKNKNYTK